MKYTFFVLDFDGTYSNEDPEDYGVEPSVYFIPKDKIEEVTNIAHKVHNEFHDNEDENDMCIGDLFEAVLKENGIKFQLVGSLHVTSGERMFNYLADNINFAVV